MNEFVKLLLTAGAAKLGYEIGKTLGATEEERKQNAIKGAFLVGGGTLLLTNIEEADTVNYILKNNGKRVYDGIAKESRFDTRIIEHTSSGKKFNEVICDSAKPRSAARNLERYRIKRFTPKYNIQHNC